MGACQKSCGDPYPCGVLGCPFTDQLPLPPMPPPVEAVDVQPSAPTLPPMAPPVATAAVQPSAEPPPPSLPSAAETSPLATAATAENQLPSESYQPPENPAPMRMDFPIQEAQPVPAPPTVEHVLGLAPPPPVAGEYPPPGHRPFGGEDLGRHRCRRGGTRHRCSHQPYDYNFVRVQSELGRQACRQYYPNDDYLNNMPVYMRVPAWPDDGRSDYSPPPPPQGRRGRQGEEGYCPNFRDFNFVPTPWRWWNSCPVRKPPSPQARNRSDENQEPTQCPDENQQRAQHPNENQQPAQHPNENQQPAQQPNENQQPAQQPNENQQPAHQEPMDCSNESGGQPGTLVYDNIVIGDPSKVAIGIGNRGGRVTAGRVSGNRVMR